MPPAAEGDGQTFSRDESCLPARRCGRSIDQLELRPFGPLDEDVAPTDMIKIMGPNTAAYLGMEDELDTLEPGKLADILLLDGDPLEGYWNWLKTKVTIKQGKVVVDKR